MKPINTYLLKLSGCLLLVIALQSCKEQPGSWKNDQIKASKREDFHTLNNDVLKSLKANDMAALKPLMSKELIDNKSTERNVELISNKLTDNNFDILDEYYTVSKNKADDTIKVTGIGENSYNIKYPGVAKETYIAFFTPKTGENKYMVTLIYGKYSYGWKISDLDLSPYTVNGKTAPELYKLAKEQYDKKYLIDANNNLALAATCLKPSSVWKYPDESGISDFYGKVMNETNAKYRFPITLSALPERPMVLSIYNKTTDAGTFPMVYYMTHINISDTNAVKAENIEVKKALGKALPGIDKDNKYVYYEAFNKYPRSDESVERFDMVEKH